MRPSYFCLIALGLVLVGLFCVTCGDDNSVSPVSAPSYMKQLDPGYRGLFSAVLENPDGTILAGGSVTTIDIDSSGSVPDTTFGYPAVIVKFEAGGDTIWTSQTGSPDSSLRIECLMSASTAGYVAGCVRSPMGPYSDVIVQRILDDGEPGWSTLINNRSFDEINDLTQVSDGGYVVAGRSSSMMGSSILFVQKINQSGGVEWDRTIGEVDTSLVASVVKELPGNELLIAGTRYIRGESRHEPYLLRLSASGDSLYSTVIEMAHRNEVLDIELMPGNGYKLLGTVSDELQGGAFVMTTDSLGAVLSIQYALRSDYFSFRDGEFTPDGAILCGSVGDAYPLSRGLIVKLNSAGMMEWEREFSDPDAAIELRAVTESSSGGYLVVGLADSDADITQKFVLIKTDSYGGVGGQ